MLLFYPLSLFFWFYYYSLLNCCSIIDKQTVIQNAFLYGSPAFVSLKYSFLFLILEFLPSSSIPWLPSSSIPCSLCQGHRAGLLFWLSVLISSAQRAWELLWSNGSNIPAISEIAFFWNALNHGIAILYTRDVFVCLFESNWMCRSKIIGLILCQKLREGHNYYFWCNIRNIVMWEVVLINTKNYFQVKK